MQVYPKCVVSHWRVRVQVAKKTWKFFQNLGFRLFGDSLASQLSHENRVFCKNRAKTQTVFQKLFSFPRIMCFSLSSLPLPLPLLKLPFSIQKPPFSSSIFTPNPRKGMGFHFFLLCFKFNAVFFMDLLFVLRYWDMVEEHGFLLFLMILIYGFCWDRWYNACFTCFYYMLMHYAMFCVVVCTPFCW